MARRYMNKSLILKEKNEIEEYDDCYVCHGKTWFKLKRVKPEVSGTYELLIYPESSYYEFLTTNLFIPLFYYDTDTGEWSQGSQKFTSKELGVLGWRSGYIPIFKFDANTGKWYPDYKN